MDTLETIFSRRSIRKFKDQPISDQQVGTQLKAGMQAPSARNAQPWHLVVISDRKILDQIPEIHPHSKMLREASLAIAVCGERALEENPEYINQDCAAVTQNILLAAHALGLGAVWLGVYPREKRVQGLRALLGIPQSVLPIALIALGHPAEELPAVDRFVPERVHWNRWGHVKP